MRAAVSSDFSTRNYPNAFEPGQGKPCWRVHRPTDSNVDKHSRGRGRVEGSAEVVEVARVQVSGLITCNVVTFSTTTTTTPPQLPFTLRTVTTLNQTCIVGSRLVAFWYRYGASGTLCCANIHGSGLDSDCNLDKLFLISVEDGTSRGEITLDDLDRYESFFSYFSNANLTNIPKRYLQGTIQFKGSLY